MIKIFICRRCLNSYTRENMLTSHKPKCENINITAIRTSPESHLHWNNHFQKNPKFFRVYADFEADNDKKDNVIGNKTTNIYNQNQVLNGYNIISGIGNILKGGYHESPLGCNDLVWFVNQVIKLENEIAFCFKNANKKINMTEGDEEYYRNKNICRFCEKEIISDKVRDHCHLTGIYRGPYHNTGNINVTQQQSNIIPFIFHIYSNYVCHLFCKKLVDKK